MLQVVIFNKMIRCLWSVHLLLLRIKEDFNKKVEF